MPFLAINGVTIPTAKGGAHEYEEIGARGRAAMGKYVKDVRNDKRKWKFRTKPVSELRSLAIVGMLQGQGLYLTGQNASSFSSASNMRDPTASTIYTRSYYAADGSPSLDENGVSEARYATLGATSFVGEGFSATPNLITSAIAQCNATAGWAGTNATLALDTSNFWQSTSSLRVTGTGATPTISYTGFYVATVSTTYTVSVYVKKANSGPASDNINIQLLEVTNGTTSSSTPVAMTAAMGWRRMTATLTTAAVNPVTLKLFVKGTSSSCVFYIDGVQLEVNAAGSFPTTFILPATARNQSDYYFSVKPQGPGGMTYNYWVTKPYAITGNAIHIAAYGASPLKEVTVYAPNGSPTQLAFTTGSPYDTLTGTVAYTGWHMVTAVVRYNPESGEVSKYLYFDGVLKNSINWTTTQGLPSFDDSFGSGVSIGGFATSSLYSYSRLNDIQILPFPVEQNTVTGWYNSGAGNTMGLAPSLRATGDFCGDTAVTVAGTVINMSTVGYQDGTVWRNNGREIEFTLEEI